MIELDGSYGEGGGALVRTALALSAFTGKSFTIKNIRAGRPKPGLKAQHLTAIKALAEICGAKTNEVKLGSDELRFVPGDIKRGIYTFDIGTAGSISLLLQAVTLPCLFASGKVTLNIIGGTCGKWQAPVDYCQNVFLPQLQRFVDKIEMKIIKRGYYPAGGGEVQLKITPRHHLKHIHEFASFFEELQLKTAKVLLLSSGTLQQVKGVVNVSLELQEQFFGDRIKKSVEAYLASLQVPISIRVEYTRTKSIGGGVTIWGAYGKDDVDYDNPVIVGSDALIESDDSPEAIGKEVADKLKKILKERVPVDYYLADQLIAFMGLLPGSSIHSNLITDHTTSNMYVVEKFLPVGFTVEGGKVSSHNL